MDSGVKYGMDSEVGSGEYDCYGSMLWIDVLGQMQ